MPEDERRVAIAVEPVKTSSDR